MVLALVVGLQSADAGTVGALVVPLKQSLHITNTQVGLLVTVSTGVGALATVLAGALADRTVRVRLLWMTLLVCSAAMALSAASPSYGWLLACRVALGAGVAVSGPVVASLIGDYFAPGERGRVYGLVLAGEGACTAVGLLVAGELGAVSWRLGFSWLAVVGFILAVAVATMLREPIRGESSRLGARLMTRPPFIRIPRVAPCGGKSLCALDPHQCRSRGGVFVRLLLLHRIEHLRGGATVRSVSDRSGRGHLAYLRPRRRRPDRGAEQWTDRRLADNRGHISARMVVGGAAFLVAAVFILPTLLTHSLPLALVFAFLAGIALGGVNPPLNAARLDIVHSPLWGTAEAVRTTLVSISTGLAPLVFGIVSTQLGGSTADANSGKCPAQPPR